MSDAWRPRTTVDDSLFQGIINVYRTERTVPVEKTLPAVGDAVTVEWGQFTDHVIIARGEVPLGTSSQKVMWVQHLHVPATVEAQDAYNTSHGGGDTMSRFYVMRRADWLDEEYEAPEVGVPHEEDAKFEDYVFATESVSKIGTDPNSIFVAIERIYMLSPKVAQYYDDDLDSDVTVTTEVIAAGTGDASSAGGVTVEIQPGNHFYDLQVTTAVVENDFPRQLPSVPADIPYRFPALLRGMELVAVWARADSAEAAPAYKEAWYFSYDLVKPTTGPYEARILRFLATDPDALRSLYPIQKIVTVNENIAIARWWAQASNLGNTAFADASQIEIPECIHGDIEIENADTISVGQDKTSLPATPGFDAFAAATTMIVGYEPRKTRHGLYEISITELNITGVYDGETVPFGTGGGSSGANTPPADKPRPVTPTAVVAADNTAVSGKTSALAEVSVKLGGITLGRAMSDADGNFSVPLDPVYKDALEVVVKSRKNGVYSLPTPVDLFDLAPGAPSATISAGLDEVSGVTEPGATIRIVMPGAAQVETATVVGTITGDGNASVVVTAAVIPASPLMLYVPVLNGDDDEAVAGKIAVFLSATPAVNDHFVPTDAGADVILTAREEAMNDTTLNVAIDNSTCTGLTPAPTSADTTPGRGAVEVVADGSGNYSFEFDPPLTSGDVLTITATDDGGTSPETEVEASATPPVLTSADFPASVYDEIEGVATVAAKVIAYLGNEALGDAVADGSGDYSITLVRPMVRGEVIQVVAVVVGSESIRSNSIYVEASDLDLEKPSFTRTSIGYVGVKPAGATAIVIREEGEVDESFATLHGNGNFVFTLPGKNGERYEVIARYAEGDSDPAYEYADVIELGAIYLLPIAYTAVGDGWPAVDWYPAEFNQQAFGYTAWQNLDATAGVTNKMWLYIPWWEDGMEISIAFPGQSLSEITASDPADPGGGVGLRYEIAADANIPTLVEATVSVPDGRSVSASFDRASNFLIPVKTVA